MAATGTRGRRLRRGLAGSLLAAVVLLLALAAALAVTLDSARGLRFVAGLAPRLTGGAVRIGAVDGRLFGGDFELRDVEYHDPSTHVQVGRAHLRWVPRALLRGRVHALKLDLENVVVGITPTPPDPSPKPLRLPSRLPVDLAIDALSLRGLRVEQAPGAPLVVDAAHFAGTWIGDRVEIAELSTALTETGPLRLSGKVQLASDRVRIETLELQGPGQLKLSGTFGLGTVASDLLANFRDWRYPLVGDAPPDVAALTGDLRFRGRLDQYAYELQAAGLAQQHPVSLKARGTGDLRSTHIDTLELQADAEAKAGSVHAQGQLAWAPALTADLDLQLTRLDPGVFVADLEGELNGRAQTRTTLAAGRPRIGFDLQLDRSKLRGQAIRLAAHGATDLRGVELESLSLDAGGGNVTAQGRLAWAPALSVDAQAQLRKFNPGVLAPQWPGALNGKLSARSLASAPAAAGTSAAAPLVNFEVQLADSRLRDYPLRLEASGTAQGAAVILKQAQLDSGSTRLTAQGRVTPPFEFTAKIASPDLAALYPKAGGRLDFELSLSGALEDPHLVTKGSGAGLRYVGEHLSTLKWDADLQPSAPSKLEVLAGEGKAGVAIRGAKLTASGAETYHHVELEVQTEQGAVNLALQGGFDRKKFEWGGEWQRVRIAPDMLPAWALEKPVGLLLGRERFSLEPACFAGEAGAGRACFNLERQVTQPGLKVTAKLEAIALAGFKPLLPKDVDLSGRLEGDGELRWVDDNIAEAHAQFRLAEARFAAPDAPALELQPSTLDVEQQADGNLHARLDLRSAQAQVEADVSATQAADFDQRPLNGRVRIRVPDLAFVVPYVSELSSAAGHIDGDLAFAGTLARPRVSGKLALADGHAKLVTPGIELSELGLSLSGNGDGPLTVSGSMVSGDGKLRIAGTVDPAQLPPRADLKISGDNFLAVAIPNGRAWITPDLHLVRDESGLRVDGSLTVPKAKITPKDLGNSGVSTSRDQVLVIDGQPQLAPVATPLKIFSHIRLALGDDVSFNGFGLKTRITGAVNVSEEPLRDATALGELRLVDGAYQAYGQDLKIEDGRLIFDGGSVAAPAVDISASRNPADNIKVGVRVRGTLKKPQLTLQSDPAMSREQQLSWLLLGRPLEQNSSQDRSAISSAALSLGLSGGDFLANRIGKKIGLDAISVGSAPAGGSDIAANATAITGSQASQDAGNAANNAAALTLGKYLTPKLFVSYGVSLFQAGQTFRLLYTLGRGFKVQAESGVASGGDLLYTYERGRTKAAPVAPTAPAAGKRPAAPEAPAEPETSEAAQTPK